MTAQFLRDAAVTAAIFGFFAAGWFGWAQEDPPPRWRKWLIGGSIISMLAALAGGIVAWQNWSAGSAIDPDTGPLFGVVVGVEVVSAVVGVAVLRWRERGDLVPAWVALVVGIHFLPLAPLLEYPLLYLVGLLVAAAAVLSAILVPSRGMAVSAATGLSVGIVLLSAAVFSLTSASI